MDKRLYRKYGNMRIKDIMREYRTEIKQKINCENFKVKQLIKL